YGVEISTGNQASNLLFANNTIANVSHDYGGSAGSTWATYGLRINLCGGIRILNNTIYLRGQYRNSGSTTSTGFSHGIGFVSTCSNNDVRNNIVSNRMTGVTGSKAWAIYATASATFTNFDFNVLDTASGNPLQGFIGNFGGTDISTLAAFQSSFGSNLNTVVASPTYLDSTETADLHLGTVPPALLRGTSAVSGFVANDMDNVARSLYIRGADEVKANITYTQQPSGATLCPGNALNLVASVASPITFNDNINRSGASPSYQWTLNGNPISGAVNATYSVSAVSATDAGVYRCITYVSTIDSAVSNPATITVNVTTSITAQPSGSSVCLGQNFTLSVSASGTALTYQWRRNGTNVTGATNASYTVAGSASTFGSYDVVITGSCGTVTSNSVTVSERTATSITAQPTASPSSVCLGGSFTLSVSAAGSNVGYQWRRNGT
ncbi:MAG: immunoglobulin domain-containing protein, partial [Candidatus Kapaibacterium sp.]